jgi:diguanylate cyclase (GGDEF)-like protein
VKDLHSALDSWRNITEAEPRADNVASYLPLILSAAGTLGILPFTVMRYMAGQWVAAIVDTTIIIGLVTLGIYVYRTRQTRFASIAIAICCLVGVLSTVYLIGPYQVYWAYPALMAIFYLTPPREALVFAIVMLLALSPSLIQTADTHVSTTILITIVVMSSFAFAFSLITNRQREQLVQLATKDPLTGAGNRRHLAAKMTDVVHGRQRFGAAASLLLLDLDHFKKVNDIHGHAVGDQILKSITDIVNLRIRVTDSLYRIGGEEFVVVLEGQDLHSAVRLAEQLRTLVEANELAPDQSVTISIGVAELKDGETPESWLHRADEALYRAKDSGRNATNIAD